MKRIFFGIMVMITLSGICQENNILVICNEKIVGKNLQDSSVINGFEYVFPERIYRTYFDTTSGLLTIQLRGVNSNGTRYKNSGYIVLYDLKYQKVLWSKKVSYKSTDVQQTDSSNVFVFYK